MHAHPPVTLRTAQALLALLGAVVLFGSVYFTLTTAAVAADWLVGAWACGIALGLLAAAGRIGGGDPAVLRVAVSLLALHVVFGAVKVVAYGEGEAATFIAADLLALGVLSTRSCRAYFAR